MISRHTSTATPFYHPLVITYPGSFRSTHMPTLRVFQCDAITPLFSHPAGIYLPGSVKRCQLSRLAVSLSLVIIPLCGLSGCAKCTKLTGDTAITPRRYHPPTRNHPPVISTAKLKQSCPLSPGFVGCHPTAENTPGDYQSRNRDHFNRGWFLTSNTGRLPVCDGVNNNITPPWADFPCSISPQFE